MIARKRVGSSAAIRLSVTNNIPSFTEIDSVTFAAVPKERHIERGEIIKLDSYLNLDTLFPKRIGFDKHLGKLLEEII